MQEELHFNSTPRQSLSPRPLRYRKLGNLASCFLIPAALTTVAAPPSRADQMAGTYAFSGPSYTVSAEFNTPCPRDSLLAICREFTHINRYLTRNNLVVTPLEEGTNWNRYRYVYTYVIYSCSLTLRRDLKPDSGLLRFRLLESHSSLSLLPTVRNTGGYYQVDPVAGTDSVKLRYFQQTTMTQGLNWLYAAAVRMETDGFLKRLIRYVDQYTQEAQLRGGKAADEGGEKARAVNLPSATTMPQ